MPAGSPDDRGRRPSAGGRGAPFAPMPRPVHGAHDGAAGRVSTLAVALEVRAPLVQVFDFFSRAENLGEITPPELGFRILTPLPVAMHEGARIDYRIRLFCVPMAWRTRITCWEPPRRFADLQERGPYAHWHHTHTFHAIEGGTRIEDRVEYRLPLGPLGALARPLVRMQLDRIFRHRSAVIAGRFAG